MTKKEKILTIAVVVLVITLIIMLISIIQKNSEIKTQEAQIAALRKQLGGTTVGDKTTYAVTTIASILPGILNLFKN